MNEMTPQEAEASEQRIASQTAEAQKPSTRKSEAKQVLGDTLYRLVRLNPTNPQVRAQVMAKCLQAPPLEAVTFPQLVDWIEFNIESPANPPDLPPSVAPRATPNQILIRCNTTEDESGRCDYTCTNIGRANVPLTEAQLVELAAGAEDLDDLMDRVKEHIGNNVWDYNETQDCTDYDYDNHQGDDCSNSNWEIAGGYRLTAAVEEFLQGIDPERLRELQGND